MDRSLCILCTEVVVEEDRESCVLLMYLSHPRRLGLIRSETEKSCTFCTA